MINFNQGSIRLAIVESVCLSLNFPLPVSGTKENVSAAHVVLTALLP
jgi:hypothetical protein